ncbi:sulfite exporter TauE/SafE family protein [Alkalicoccus luteus]|uniref:Probable membrane transporter protein n=1 Tax=Alkalicoccus luteus TaxID=1237094 RepID=A0A969TU29_9BACI|nr:sulfite exporter TauE/SafE family protein [Alkalicoccus luteus]NJP38288.1 sulfite exporter TauE/SafE family protein [Alkalicoccus luteus]
MEWIALAVLGLAAAIIGSVMGLGGGIIIVPALMVLGGYTELLSGITPQTAVGTSLLVMIFTGLSSTLAYMKQKVVDLKSGLLFFAGSGPGALFGVWLNSGIDVASFLIAFGVFIIIVSFILLIRHRIKPIPLRPGGIKRTFREPDGTIREYGYEAWLGISIAFFVGMFSGLFGIGGGSLMVPAMIILFAFPPHFAVATSMFLVFLSALVSSASHVALGNVDWVYAAALIPGAWFGGKIGAWINRRLKSDTLVLALRVVLLLIGIRLIYEGITGL